MYFFIFIVGLYILSKIIENKSTFIVFCSTIIYLTVSYFIAEYFGSNGDYYLFLFCLTACFLQFQLLTEELYERSKIIFIGYFSILMILFHKALILMSSFIKTIVGEDTHFSAFLESHNDVFLKYIEGLIIYNDITTILILMFTAQLPLIILYKKLRSEQRNRINAAR